MSEKRALVLIAQGTEEIEFTVTYDTLVRAGITPTSALVGPSAPTVKCSRGVIITPDTELSAVNNPASFDALLIPGGAAGADAISKDTNVQKLVKSFITDGKVVGMICAGTLTALTSDLPRQPLTSHPSVQSQLDKNFDYSTDSVVVSGTLVTSRGPGTTLAFVLQVIELLVGKEKRDEVAGPMMIMF